MTQLVEVAQQGGKPDEKVGRWVEQVLNKGSFHRYTQNELWAPSVNLYEDQSHYCLVAELAGVRPENIDLRVENGVLRLTGERATPPVEEACGSVSLHLMEIDHGPFRRDVDLPSDVDIDSISATYKNGYLWIKLPKR